MKIAIVGSGIAGLTAAYRLWPLDHHITVFERSPSLGLSEHTLEWASDSGTQRVDVPLRLMNQFQWPEIVNLYQDISVETDQINASLSFSDINETSYLNLDFSSLFASTASSLFQSRARQIVQEIARFRSIGLKDLSNSLGDDISLNSYLANNDFSDAFKFGFLFPILSSTVCTCSYAALANYPARIILESLAKITTSENMGDLVLFKARHGMQDVSSRLARKGIEVRTNVAIESVSCGTDQVTLQLQRGDSNQNLSSESFDHVILATQANHAARLLSTPDNKEQEMLNCFDYETIEVVVHQDQELLPPKKDSWKAFNMISQNLEGHRAMCSIWLNRFAPALNLSPDMFQTINPLFEPEEEKTLLKTSLQRPIVDRKSFRGWKLLEEIHDEADRRIWFVGSYASPGVPLLETGVVSSQRVVDAIRLRHASSSSSS